ncbi:hypothetical protein CVT26_008717 [Gymnopilus dilepis]|uniref:Uncharacterized protein n=1 Tax=Gymnopilus dilepis TaxID=231916 RepID=A0A409YG80_9AGAR|nr:hypothetical protein CVT26_008717 [Gymnopilus dilepis]
MSASGFIRELYEWNADKYTYSGLLMGHLGPVNVLSFNNNGSLLASGGDDEQVKIWDVNQLRQCQSLMNPQGRWGQITCLKFITFDTPPTADWLCFGTGRGIIAMYRKSRKAAEFTEMWSLPVFSAGDSVEALAFDPIYQRFAVGSHYGQIKLLRYQNGKIAELWADEVQDAIPRALLFADTGRSLNIYILETGLIITRDAETSAKIGTRQLKTPIVTNLGSRVRGYVAHCKSTGNILVDNMQDGFDLHMPNRVGPARTYRIAMSEMYVKAGVFCEGGKVIACGSDHGRVYIFSSGEEQVKQELVHRRRQDLIQAVEILHTQIQQATTVNGFHIIVSGSSTGKCEIHVWKKPVKRQAYRERRQLLEGLVAANAIFLIAFLLITSEAWTSIIEEKYRSITAAMSESSVIRHDLQDINANLEHKMAESASAVSVVERILFELDGRSSRRLLKMPPALLPNDLLEVADESEMV